MKTKDETQARRTLNLVAPAGQMTMALPAPRVEGDELFPEMDEQPKPATDKQRNYIAVLMDDLGWHSEQIAVYADEQRIDLVQMTKEQASVFIDGLKHLAHPEKLPPLKIPTFTSVQCVVCNLRTKIPIDAPARLCGPCTADLQMTRNHVEMTLEKGQANHEAAVLTWAAALESADPAALARWDKAEAMIRGGQDTSPAFRATWEREKGAETALGRLLRAYEAYTTAERMAGEIKAWADRATQEIEAAAGAAMKGEWHAIPRLDG